MINFKFFSSRLICGVHFKRNASRILRQYTHRMTGCCCCFPPSAKVLTTTGYVRVTDLKPRHKLLTKTTTRKRLAETEFCTYLHYDPDVTAEFLVIVCDNGAELIISEKHLLFKIVKTKDKPEGTAVAGPAKSIAVGDQLVYIDDSNSTDSTVTVTNIETRTIQGVYAPLTGKGTLIVDGFHVSCYAEVGSHALAHAATAPLRAWCRKIGKRPEKHVQVEGVHGYAKVLAVFAGIKA